jgi:hypothetical protein
LFTQKTDLSAKTLLYAVISSKAKFSNPGSFGAAKYRLIKGEFAILSMIAISAFTDASSLKRSSSTIFISSYPE